MRERERRHQTGYSALKISQLGFHQEQSHYNGRLQGLPLETRWITTGQCNRPNDEWPRNTVRDL